MLTSVALTLTGLVHLAGPPLAETTFTLEQRSEVVATVTASCARCDWGVEGREAAALTIAVDGRYRAHVMLTQGERDAEYRVLLGQYGRGTHRVRVNADRAASARGVGDANVRLIVVTTVGERDEEYAALAHAPVLYARPSTIGRFTDVPLVMWYETAATPRGRSYRYSVVFSNEDGGTATDRLMATWGRATDIEFVYGVEVDANGRRLSEEFQGPEHVVTPFGGKHEQRHPLEFVVTDNNMVSDRGTTAVRYAPAPERFDLTDVSREVVMDAHPWTYRVMAGELSREAKIVAGAEAGSGTIPDPRRFVFVEACTELAHAALSFGVRAATPQGTRWFDSDRGRDQFRIVRTGCFRGAVPLPEGASSPDAIRFRAWPRADGKGLPSVRVTRVNSVFTLGDDLLPNRLGFRWAGSMPLPTDGTPAPLTF